MVAKMLRPGSECPGSQFSAFSWLFGLAVLPGVRGASPRLSFGFGLHPHPPGLRRHFLAPRTGSAERRPTAWRPSRRAGGGGRLRLPLRERPGGGADGSDTVNSTFSHRPIRMRLGPWDPLAGMRCVAFRFILIRAMSLPDGSRKVPAISPANFRTGFAQMPGNKTPACASYPKGAHAPPSSKSEQFDNELMKLRYFPGQAVRLVLWRLAGWAFICALSGRAATTNVSVLNTLTYMPVAVTINEGDTVQWTWSGTSASHSSTSDTGLWDSGIHSAPFSFPLSFTSAGTFPYHCSNPFHTDDEGLSYRAGGG